MAFFQSAVGTLQTFVIALGAGIGIWSLIKEREERKFRLNATFDRKSWNFHESLHPHHERDQPVDGRSRRQDAGGDDVLAAGEDDKVLLAAGTLSQ